MTQERLEAARKMHITRVIKQRDQRLKDRRNVKAFVACFFLSLLISIPVSLLLGSQWWYGGMLILSVLGVIITFFNTNDDLIKQLNNSLLNKRIWKK